MIFFMFASLIISKLLIMKNKIILALSLIFFISLNSCKTSSVIQQGERFEATSPSEVKLFFSKIPEKSYIEIGKVSVDKYSNLAIKRSGDKLNELLKEKAASIGGQAIISITEDFASMSGTVIRYN